MERLDPVQTARFVVVACMVATLTVCKSRYHRLSFTSPNRKMRRSGVIRTVKATYIIAVLAVSACILMFYFRPLYNLHHSSYALKDVSFPSPWVKASPEIQVYIFSAYLDERYHKKVVAIGIESRNGHPALYCLLRDGEGHTMCLQKPISKGHVFDHCYTDYCQYFYVCSLSTSTLKPEFVSFSSNASCLQSSPWIPVTQQTVKQSNFTQSFGICFASPVYRTSTQFIAESIEMKRILGAEKMTVYIHNASTAVWKVLKDYSTEGLVEVLNSTLPINSTQVNSYAQLALLQDCAYRNMYQVKYLFFNDLDEVVVPLKHQNWSQMMADIDQESIGAFVFQHVLLQKDTKIANSSHMLCNSTGKAEAVPRIISHTKRSHVFPRGRTKFIVKPTKFTRIRIHQPGKLQMGYSEYLVPHDTALLYHYRIPPLHVGTEIPNDTTLMKYFPELIARIERRICKF